MAYRKNNVLLKMILDCLILHLKPRNEENIIYFWKTPLLNVTLEKNESRHDGPTGPLKTNTLSLYGSCHLAPRLYSALTHQSRRAAPALPLLFSFFFRSVWNFDFRKNGNQIVVLCLHRRCYFLSCSLSL